MLIYIRLTVFLLFGSLFPLGILTANMAPERGKLIAKSDFPLYVVKSLGERHFLVAGGGGQAKTGVSNTIVSVFAL